MTKEITKAIILQEIQNKFKLRELEPAKFLFDETVVPVYDIGRHVHSWWQSYKTVTINGTGPLSIKAVPPTEHWHLARYDVVFMTGAYTIAGIYIKRKNQAAPDSFIYLDLKAAQSVSYHIDLVKDVVLEPGDEIMVNVDGYTTTGAFRFYYDYRMEEIR